MFDLAIIGSGFAGTLLGRIARRLGRSVLLLEKHRHPRFVIGESSTPLADLVWLELCRRYGLADLEPFAKWGTWRRAHPEVACGLKRGFTFYHHRRGQPFAADAQRRDQLIVAASPRDEIADTHWYRPDFDHFLVRSAVSAGVEFIDGCEVTSVAIDASGASLEARHQRRPLSFRARFVVDAGNHRGVVVRSLGLEDFPLPRMPRTQGLYTHFTGVRRLDTLPLHAGLGEAPYPVDDAAVHHVFEGGWIWVLRFVNGITSAGVAATETVAQRWNLGEGAAAWNRVLADLPTVARQFAEAHPVHPWVHAPRLGFRTSPASDVGWALLPSAAGFVDPMLSSGFVLSLLGIERLAEALDRGWHRTDRWREMLADYSTETAADLLALEHFVAALYARMGDFAAFTEIARLYFCAVVYCETARRLGRPEVAGGFLMRRHPRFAPAASACCDAAIRGTSASELRAMVDRLLAEFDLGGLADESRRPWYPVKAEDLRSGRDRIGAGSAEVEALLQAAGWAA